MYTASINNKEFSKGRLQVSVVYSNGNPDDEFAETYSINTQEDLSSSIRNRLNLLEKVEQTYNQIVLGAFTVKPEAPDNTALENRKIKLNEAYSHLQKGVITKDEYDLILLEYKTALAAT